MTYLSVKQVAARYNVHEKTIWRWVRESAFPTPTKFSPKVTRWCERDLDRHDAELKAA
jgi:predicted DNA-binding transcriptional regulator AlpA